MDILQSPFLRGQLRSSRCLPVPSLTAHTQSGTTSQPLFHYILTEITPMQKAKAGHDICEQAEGVKGKKNLIFSVFDFRKGITQRWISQRDSSIFDVRSAVPSCFKWISVIFMFSFLYCCRPVLNDTLTTEFFRKII